MKAVFRPAIAPKNPESETIFCQEATSVIGRKRCYSGWAASERPVACSLPEHLWHRGQPPSSPQRVPHPTPQIPGAGSVRPHLECTSDRGSIQTRSSFRGRPGARRGADRCRSSALEAARSLLTAQRSRGTRRPDPARPRGRGIGWQLDAPAPGPARQPASATQCQNAPRLFHGRFSIAPSTPATGLRSRTRGLGWPAFSFCRARQAP